MVTASLAWQRTGGEDRTQSLAGPGFSLGLKRRIKGAPKGGLVQLSFVQSCLNLFFMSNHSFYKLPSHKLLSLSRAGTLSG